MREGEYGLGRLPVVSHALDIPQRLKEVDEHYFIVFNTAIQRYEVHWEGAGMNSLECVLPFDELDERAVRHVRAHQMERLAILQAEVEEHNRRMEEEAQRRWLEKAAERTREAFRYLDRNSRTDEIPKELMEG